MDAVINCNTPLTEERLFSWHTLLFSESRSGRYKIITGAYRTDENGSMQVISGSIGREIVHYQAPPASVVPQMMEQFLKWFNTSAADQGLDAVLKSAIAHVYFVSIHPFEDGNGRIARAIADMALHRSTSLRTRDYLFSMSAQLSKERKEYYTQLECTDTIIRHDQYHRMVEVVYPVHGKGRRQCACRIGFRFQKKGTLGRSKQARNQ